MDGVEERSARFNAYYTAAQAPVIDELQRRVLGSAGGGNGHTHVGQLPVLVSALRLGPNSALLEIGAGAGWPGLALASQSGCRVVLTDPHGGRPRSRRSMGNRRRNLLSSGGCIWHRSPLRRRNL